MRATSRSFKLGDRIEIGDYRGDVIDYNLFTTTILETGPGKLTLQSRSEDAFLSWLIPHLPQRRSD